MDLSPEKRRSDACDKLRQGMDGKLLMGGGDRAVRLLKEAHGLATKPTRLHWPLPEVTAYRYAYVLMRSAKSASDLRRVHKLLVKARAGATLDPLQHALEIVVCERLRAVPDEDPAAWMKMSRDAFGRLVEAAKTGDASVDGRPVQGQVFNVVELCAFMLGENYQDLFGRAALAPAPFPPRDMDGFVLVGTHGVDHGIVMDRSFAFGEFKARIDAGEVDIAFVYEHEPQLRLQLHDLRLPTPAARYLPHMCLREPLPPRKIAGQEENLNKSLSGLRKKLLTGPKLSRLDSSFLKKDGDICSFDEGVRVLGVISQARWVHHFPNGPLKR